MGWRKTDSQKRAEGTFRADRAAPILPLAEAEARLSEVLTKLSEAEAKLPTFTGRKKQTAKRNLEKRIAILQRHRAQALEDITAAAAAEQARAAMPSIRPGLENYGWREVQAANPPLSDAETTEWLCIGPRTDIEAAQRRRAAGLPDSVEGMIAARFDLAFFEKAIADGKQLDAAQAAHLAVCRSLVNGATAPPPPSPSEPTFYQTFIARLRENAAKGFSTPRTRKLIKEHDARQKKTG